MDNTRTTIECKATLQQPAESGADWLFLVLPKAASDGLPRRGRTTVDGTLNGAPFRATLDPDGQLSHWLRVDAALQSATGAAAGDEVTLELRPVAIEPDPEVPADLRAALDDAPAARAAWDDITPLARLDWIHWIDSAKREATRAKRVGGACDRLAKGKRQVCCFDNSGYYDKSQRAPQAAGQ